MPPAAPVSYEQMMLRLTSAVQSPAEPPREES
jgi:hypothetical protein